MTYGSVCSGIEAATVAWHPLGWRPAFFAEIDRFPSAVLAHRFPEVRNLGDFTRIDAAAGPVDLLVGGTPCQSFSVAGLRGGMDDARGVLALEFLRLARRLRARWVVWENVPGVLSSNGGRDFGAFLGGLAELGYGCAYRVLDAQFFGVPQRRRRVFVVGYLGDWRPPVGVLFERASLSGHPAPRREAGKDVAGALTGSLGRRCGVPDNGDTPGQLIAHSLRAKHNLAHRPDVDTFVAHTLRGEGFDASEDGTGRGTPLVACTLPASDGGVSSGYHPVVPIDMRQASRGEKMTNNRREGSSGGAPGTGIGEPGDPAPSLSLSHPPAIAFQERGRADGRTLEWQADQSYALRAVDGGGCGDWFRINVGTAPRRLTPRECERLQGFPDDWTLVPYRGKPAADGPRYKAIGNSMAVPVMAWIGKRIQVMEDMISGDHR